MEVCEITLILEEEKEEDQPGPSKKPSSTSLDSKIVLGKRKRENKKKEGLTLDNKDSNLSIELKISGNLTLGFKLHPF